MADINLTVEIYTVYLYIKKEKTQKSINIRVLILSFLGVCLPASISESKCWVCRVRL